MILKNGLEELEVATINNAVLLDTSFFLRFLNDSDELFANADAYYKYFLEHDITLVISTITIAEYCVGGSIDELPLRNMQIIPFNIDHAVKAGEFAKIIFEEKGKLKLRERNLIPNDTKLFAQAEIEKHIKYYLSSDTESLKIYKALKKTSELHFDFIDLHQKYTEVFGLLDFQ